mmetsp:Transcript_50443/g.117101  ORF Transcript_50443/g.117101 Transcript_50443/m.117101 type:complete len:307 (-) Transcript_50443:488-1408(-)
MEFDDLQQFSDLRLLILVFVDCLLQLIGFCLVQPHHISLLVFRRKRCDLRLRLKPALLQTLEIHFALFYGLSTKHEPGLRELLSEEACSFQEHLLFIQIAHPCIHQLVPCLALCDAVREEGEVEICFEATPMARGGNAPLRCPSPGRRQLHRPRAGPFEVSQHHSESGLHCPIVHRLCRERCGGVQIDRSFPLDSIVERRAPACVVELRTCLIEAFGYHGCAPRLLVAYVPMIAILVVHLHGQVLQRRFPCLWCLPCKAQLCQQRQLLAVRVSGLPKDAEAHAHKHQAVLHGPLLQVLVQVRLSLL